VNAEQLATRVAVLASSTGQLAPPITWVEGVDRSQALWVEPPGPVGPMLFVRHCVDEKLPDFVQDALIAEELVQASLKAREYQKQILRTASVVGTSAIAAFTFGAYRVIDETWLLLVVVGLGIAVLSPVARAITFSVRWRPFMRRTDRTVADILGRERLVEVLRWYAAQPPRLDLWWNTVGWFWFKNGAPPTARARLRWLKSISG
jgi:hypothetical protein